jgi:hypothetical protein
MNRKPLTNDVYLIEPPLGNIDPRKHIIGMVVLLLIATSIGIFVYLSDNERLLIPLILFFGLGEFLILDNMIHIDTRKTIRVSATRVDTNPQKAMYRINGTNDVIPFTYIDGRVYPEHTDFYKVVDPNKSS